MDRKEEQYELEKAQAQFQSNRRYERRPQSARDLLGRLMARRGFSQDLFNEELQSAWQSAVGKSFAGKTQATLIKRGTLEVLVDSSPALQQLTFIRKQLLEKIQATLPQAGIKALRFKVGKVRT